MIFILVAAMDRGL